LRSRKSSTAPDFPPLSVHESKGDSGLSDESDADSAHSSKDLKKFEKFDNKERKELKKFFWKPAHELALLKTMLDSNPLLCKQGSIKAGWELVATLLNDSNVERDLDPFAVTERSCREKFEFLRKAWNEKESNSKRASGVSETETEAEKLISDIVLTARSAHDVEQEKALDEKQIGMRIRDDAMATYGKKRKEQDDTKKESWEKDYLRIKQDDARESMKLREKELDLKQLELKAKICRDEAERVERKEEREQAEKVRIQRDEAERAERKEEREQTQKMFLALLSAFNKTT